jgi:hypothetical protein
MTPYAAALLAPLAGASRIYAIEHNTRRTAEKDKNATVTQNNHRLCKSLD